MWAISRIYVFLAAIGLLPTGLRLRRMVTQQDHAAVLALRERAYRQRYPWYHASEDEPSVDTGVGTSVLMVEQVRSGTLLGTLRVRYSSAGRVAAGLDEERYPNAFFELGTFFSVDRFCIVAPSFVRPLVRWVLFAAVIRMAREGRVAWLYVYARPPLVPLYEYIGLREVVPRVVRPDDPPFHLPHYLLRAPLADVLRQAKLPGAAFLVLRFGLGEDVKALVPPLLERELVRAASASVASGAMESSPGTPPGDLDDGRMAGDRPSFRPRHAEEVIPTGGR